MHIKKISLKDINALYELGLQQFKGEYWYTGKFLTDTMKIPGLFYGAFEGKKLIGGIQVRLYDKPKCWIYFFVVDKKHRQEGIGTKLLLAVEKNMPKGYFLILVDFGNTDITAKKFYVKNGFKKVATIPNWFGRGSLDFGWLYAKKL